jgi:ABC-2 type transport system ATP-binding protein
MNDPVISIQGLVKRYGKVEALRGVTADIPAGPVGLLGPNGAGKTTMIKLLLGLLVPTEGSASIAGCDPSKKADRLEVRKRVGYMPEGDCLLPETSAVELVTTLARLTGLSRQDAMTRAHEVLDYVELEEARYRQVVEFSTGMKQRMKLAQALVHDPQILLLDEPTNGLDPKGRRHMLTLIDDLGRGQGKNVLLCSHLLPDVEQTCDHVIVLDEGRVVEDGAVADMTREDGLAIKISVEGDPAALRVALAEAAFTVEDSGARLLVHLGEGSEDADALFAVAASAGATITSLEPVKSSLEEVFLRAVGVDAAEQPPAIEAEVGL